ncbi:MAG: PPC domain-containing protein [Planctomycetes bacterium]|nr:PPC domain-containing protein [Planctomycetota bacterium]
MLKRFSILFLAICGTLALGGSAFSASPTIGAPTPRGVQRGTEAVLTIGGGNLADAQELFFYTPGFSVTKLEAVSAAQIKATIKIAPETQLGEHIVRVRTATGISNMMTFWVGALPIIEEKEPNSDFLEPQKIAMNVTVTGIVQSEDVDYFAVEAKKGQRISLEIEALRLGTTFFDPYIAILDSKRFELASSDDSTLLKQDGCLSIVAPADGTYIVQVRESSYGGNGACNYRLHVGNFPRPLAVVPAGGKLGEEVEVRFLGDASGEIKQKIKLPATMPPDGKFGLYCQDATGISPSPLPFRLSADFGNCNEVEPNDTHVEATSGTFPCAFHGVIEKPGDIDHFKFMAKKGQVFDVHCYARRIGSPLDSVMGLALKGGANFASNDDAVGPDSYFRVTIPQDGEFVLSITDHLKQGGPTYAYRVEFTPVVPKINLGVPKVALYSQERQSFPVPRGNRFATMVSAARVDVGGDLAINVEGLPAKVTLTTEEMTAGQALVPVVLEAAADAPVAGSLGAFTAKPIDPKATALSNFSLMAEYIIGAPGQSIYWTGTVSKAAFAVTQEAPFKINIVEPKVPLVQNGVMMLKIVAERSAGFKGPITVIPLYNPPGVSSATSVIIPEGQNEALLTINANGGAPIRKWKYAVKANAPTAAGVVWVSSQLATLEVAAPYMTMTFERGAVEQGKETQMFMKVTNVKPFVANAKVKLIGLPAKVTTVDVDILKDTKEISFPIKTEPTVNAGTTRNLFCQITIIENGEPVVHNIGATELRIDIPLPPKKDQPMTVAVQPKVNPMPNPMGMPPKRLSRLEQLRLEQEEREKAAKENPMPKTAEPKK